MWDVADIHEDINPSSGLIQDVVLKQRSAILDALCTCGSSEHLEQVINVMLAQEQLTWEDYQNVQVSGRALYTNARQLLDLVYTKGAETCEFFLSALQQVLPDLHGLELSPQAICGPQEYKRDWQSTSSHSLLSQRPRLVEKLQGCISGALEVLTQSGHFSSLDCDQVLLSIHTPSQQARHLLNRVRSKGELAANVLLQFIQEGQESCSASQQGNMALSKEFLKYQKKLSSSVCAQSCFVSTYGGTAHMSLDDIYTEGQLEVAPDCAGAQDPLGLADVVGVAGSVNEEADTVLVCGEAGSGKSTLLQRLHLLWARKVAHQQFLLLFPFSCRRLNSQQKELSVRELLFQHCCWPDRAQEEIFQFILDHPHLIIFTFDGLDEIKQVFSDEQRLCCPTQKAPVHILLFNLIQGSLMKGVQKVVTSRPEAVAPSLKKHLRKELFLKGFSPSGIDCFVRKHHNDPAVASKVLESLQSNTALLGLCHSPVLCWIVSHCHKELLGCGEGSPKTITDIYLMIVQHFLQHKNPQMHSDRLCWLQSHSESVLRLGHLAHEGIKATCFVFSATDLETYGVTEKDTCLGFLVQCIDLSSMRSKRYEFLHVTLQCFFAALYIVLSNDMDLSAITELFELKHMKEPGVQMVCFGSCLFSTSQLQRTSDGEATEAEKPNLQITATFVSGLLSHRHQDLWTQCLTTTARKKKVRQVAKCLSKALQEHFKSIPPPVTGEKKSMHAMPGFIWLIKCIYEMQESRIAKDAMSGLEVDHLKLTFCNIGPVECTALAYVLQHLRNPVGLQLDNNFVGDVGVEQLLPCLHICRSLYLRNNNITDEGIRKLIAKGIQCDHFKNIALFNNRLTDACTQHFSFLLKNRKDFLSIRLGNNNITAEGAKQLAEGLRVNHSLKYLGLWGNKIGDSGAQALAVALEGSASLCWLSLVGNNIGSAGARALASIIKNSVSLEELWLSENSIDREGVDCMIEALQNNTMVKAIWLKNNNLSSEEVQKMMQQESRLVF